MAPGGKDGFEYCDRSPFCHSGLDLDSSRLWRDRCRADQSISSPGTIWPSCLWPSFLQKFLTTEKLRELLKDLNGYPIERYELPNLLDVNFYIKGILGEGEAASIRLDAQAKTLGEYLRAKIVEIPESIVPV